MDNTEQLRLEIVTLQDKFKELEAKQRKCNEIIRELEALEYSQSRSYQISGLKQEVKQY